MGLLSHSFFQRSGVHWTGLRFFTSKTCRTVVRLGASKARSHTARLTTTVIRQKINLLVGVKKKMVLLLSACETRVHSITPSDVRLRIVVHALVVDELDGHSQPVLLSDGVAHDHERDVFVAERFGTTAASGLS